MALARVVGKLAANGGNTLRPLRQKIPRRVMWVGGTVSDGGSVSEGSAEENSIEELINNGSTVACQQGLAEIERQTHIYG
jgi:hypothetical protein